MKKALIARRIERIAKSLVASQSRVNMWCKEITKHYNGLMEALDQAVAEGATALSKPKDKMKALSDELHNAIRNSYKK